jgi:hypothetical protein
MPDDKSASQSSNLDYLVEAGKLSPSPSRDVTGQMPKEPLDDGLTGSLAAFAARLLLGTVLVIESEQGGERKGVRLSECSRRISGMTADVIVPIALRLEKAGLLTIVERDAFGDHAVATTPKAVELIEGGDSVDLMRELGVE